MASKRVRMCPICNKKDIKYLSEHLKRTHKLTKAVERAPHLKKSLQQAKQEETAVKRKDTVCSEEICAEIEFREQERKLSASFQEIEDHIVAIRLKASRMGYNGTSVQRVRMDVRSKLMPLYEMVMNSLVSTTPPPAQFKRKSEEDHAERKRRRLVKEEDDTIVSYSTAGMDFLDNGQVRCQTCHSYWDENTTFKCLCGAIYNGPSYDSSETTSEGTLDFLDNGLVRCRDCHFEWDGNAQHDCAFEPNTKNCK